MRHLQKFEAFSDYTKKIKEIGGKIGDKIGGIFGNPSKAIKSVGNDIKNTANLKIYNTEEYRLAALALISINDDFDKFNKLANYTFDAKDKDFKPTEESEKMLRYYIDMLPEKKEDLIMLSKIDTSLLNQSKRKSLASRFKVPKFEGQSNKVSFTGVK